MPDPEPTSPRVSRRRLLAGLGAGSAGLALSAVATPTPAGAAPSAPDRTGQIVPWTGAHQAGVATPPPSHLAIGAFDVTGARLVDLQTVLETWTRAIARLTVGLPAGPQLESIRPPSDPGSAAELGPAALTITVGVGPSVFDDRFGLAPQRPAALAPLPSFAGDQLDPARSGGDLVVQCCAQDPQVAFHALHALRLTAGTLARPRWTQLGFVGRPEGGETPRNLMGFKDGTVNPRRAEMDDVVWARAGDGTRWMADGTYLVFRRIRMHLEKWDAEHLEEQQEIIGRIRSTGAPLGASREHATPDLAAEDADGPVIPVGAHIRVAGAKANGGARLLRRGYSYSDGVAPDGTLDAGLVFLAFQRDPRAQFTPIQQRLASEDALRDYVTHTASGVYAILPGVREGGTLGETLLARAT